MRRAMALIAMLGLVGNAWAAEDDPELAAALAKCPGAAAFVRADEQHRQALAQRLAGSVPTEPRLRERLLEMARIDQQARDGDWSPPMIEKMLAVDAANLPEIRRIVADHGGLPRAGQVGCWCSTPTATRISSARFWAGSCRWWKAARSPRTISCC